MLCNCAGRARSRSCLWEYAGLQSSHRFPHTSPTAPAPSPHCGHVNGPTIGPIGGPHLTHTFGLSHKGPIVWGPHVPRISRRYWGPQWAAHVG
ncbi:hypothetical protein QQF64_031491 [Cirrhinus molitorella]|uniref:Uncharacterized protein n=1 Tax=Cirrhinus molitorella TaxID=172907 RepID=A0ABR3MX67_9TELE